MIGRIPGHHRLDIIFLDEIVQKHTRLGGVQPAFDCRRRERGENGSTACDHHRRRCRRPLPCAGTEAFRPSGHCLRAGSFAGNESGYRLSISPTGNRALKSCLPDAVFDRLTVATGEPSRGVTFLDHRLNRLMAIDLPVHDRGSLDSERPIGRPMLRRALLDGMDDAVRFSKTFVSYEDEPDGRVSALFSDGAKATGDLIVGADGASRRSGRNSCRGSTASTPASSRSEGNCR